MRLLAIVLAAALISVVFTVSGAMPSGQTIVIKFDADGAASILSPGTQGSTSFTTDPAQVVDRGRSLLGNSMGSTNMWNEFFHSRSDIFPAHSQVEISFDYKILSCEDDTKFYGLVKSLSDPNKSAGFTDYVGGVGKDGKFHIKFNTEGTSDYYIILGIEKSGEESVNHLSITAIVATPAPPFPNPIHFWTSEPDITYYVDSISGSDDNDGLTSSTAWRSLDRINSGTFESGDSILLKAGSQWPGFLAPTGSGTFGHPVVIRMYGVGAKPKIDASGNYRATVYLFNAEYWKISGLDVSNTSANPIDNLIGVCVNLQNFGTAHSITLQDLYVHDVDGSDDKDSGGGRGIGCMSSGKTVPTRFDGLSIVNCHVVHTDRDGITMSAYYQRPEWPLSTHVVIRGNLLEDIGGDGIVPIGCDGCLVEHNILRGGRMRASDYAAGIWPWSCDNTIVQYNAVSGMRGTNDGEGYDSDYNCRNSLFQYNYSHNNDGGFMLICDDGSQSMPWNIGNSGTVIRYNISVNDADHTFHITGPCQNIKIYNNVFLQRKSLDTPFVLSENWGGGWSDGVTFANNVFDTAGKSDFQLGQMTNVTFENNSYWGQIDSLPSDPTAVTANPRLKSPGSSSLSGYILLPNSPLIAAGKPIATTDVQDFWGNPVPLGSSVNIGAWQGH